MSEGDSTAWRTLASPALLRWLAVAGGAMLIIGVTAHVLVTLTDASGFVAAFAGQFERLFYAGAEYTVWAWYTAVLMAAGGVMLAVVAALLHRTDADAGVPAGASAPSAGSAGSRSAFAGSAGSATGSPGAPYAILAAVALALSIDETAQLHEGLTALPRTLGIGPVPTVEWLVAGIPIAVLAGAGLLIVARRIDARLRRGLIIGGALFLFGAIVLEGLGGALARSVDLAVSPVAAVGFEVLLAVEEGVELAGVLVALAAVLAMLETRGAGRAVSLRVRGAGDAASVEA